MRVIITGGTGLIGQPLAAELGKRGHEVILLSRSPKTKEGLPVGVRIEGWDAKSATGWGHLADGAGAIINLAGENIAGNTFLPERWTDERKRLIRESRENAGKAVVEAVQQAATKPGVVIQMSGVDYYPYDNHQPMTEEAPAANTFLGNVVQAWEAATAPVETLGVRRCILRTAIVLTDAGGVLPRLALPFKLFAGGPIGSGQQPVPWVALEDVVSAILFLLETPTTSGVYNLAAPEKLTNAQFGKVLGKVLGRPAFFPTPGFVFQLAFGEVAELLLQGRHVQPQRLQAAGFQFQYPTAEAALRHIYGK
ncbi:MAG TPA: TIGR01777 family oxidoreductase [Phototrophicaceae bacterium]|nr:TIGR01777 family oxidoreductase [Phototrophicaceae bacterium]